MGDYSVAYGRYKGERKDVTGFSTQGSLKERKHRGDVSQLIDLMEAASTDFPRLRYRLGKKVHFPKLDPDRRVPFRAQRELSRLQAPAHLDDVNYLKIISELQQRLNIRSRWTLI